MRNIHQSLCHPSSLNETCLINRKFPAQLCLFLRRRKFQICRCAPWIIASGSSRSTATRPLDDSRWRVRGAGQPLTKILSFSFFTCRAFGRNYEKFRKLSYSISLPTFYHMKFWPKAWITLSIFLNFSKSLFIRFVFKQNSDFIYLIISSKIHSALRFLLIFFEFFFPKTWFLLSFTSVCWKTLIFRKLFVKIQQK